MPKKSIRKVSIRQIKAARALLDWSQEQLADSADVSIPTIKRLEASDGPLGGRSETGEKIRTTLEAAGIGFIDENGGGPGVRLRTRQARLKPVERGRLHPSPRAGPKGSGGMFSSGLRGTAQSMLPQGSSLSSPKDLYKSNRIEATDDVTLTSELMRAARGLLRWAQPDLSAASLVSLATIKRLEAKHGVLAANATTVAALRRALQSAGIEFTGGTSPGVKLKGAPVSAAPKQRRRGRKQEPQP